MLTIEEIKENQEIMDCLNLEMTPEKAVATTWNGAHLGLTVGTLSDLTAM